MSRFEDYTPSDAYWAGYRDGRWTSPWYYSSYYPWYDSWYDPWYYGSYWGWYSPYYYPCVITMVTGGDGTDPATSTLHMPVHDGAVQVSLITGTPQRHTIVMQAMCVTMVRVTPVTTIPIRRRVLIRLLTIPVLTVEATVAEALAEAVAEAALLAVATLTVEGDKTG